MRVFFFKKKSDVVIVMLRPCNISLFCISNALYSYLARLWKNCKSIIHNVYPKGRKEIKG